MEFSVPIATVPLEESTTSDQTWSLATEANSQASPSTTINPQVLPLTYSELSATLSNLSAKLKSLYITAEKLRAVLRYHRWVIENGASTNIFDRMHRDPRVLVTNLQHNVQLHFLNSVTMEIQMRLYAKLAPDFDNVMIHQSSLFVRSKRYKMRMGALVQEVRAVEWLWGEISGGGVYDKELEEEEVVVNPYQDYLAEGPYPEEDKKEQGG